MADKEPYSSSSFSHGRTHDVFISFFGDDTRDSFTGYLRNALEEKGIIVFKDDTCLPRGEHILAALLKAIEDSRIAIIVFSKNYASSTHCLDELVKIIECMKEMGLLVLPVFYRVNPSKVRCQKGSFAKSMAHHEAKVNISKEWLLKWRDALTQAADLSGWHYKKGYEFKLIQRITKEILSRLNPTFSHATGHLVELKREMLQLMSHLNMKFVDNVHMVEIHGIGGVNKTTIAQAIYSSIASELEGSSFLTDARNNWIKYGLVQLEETLLLDLFAEKSIKIGDVSKGIPIIKHRLGGKKVVLILDDHSNKGGSVAFWVRRKFPAIAVIFLLGGASEPSKDFPCECCLLINGRQIFHGNREWPIDYVWLFDPRIDFPPQEWLGLKDYLKPGWNHVEIKCKITSGPPNVSVKCSGIHFYKENVDNHDVSFINLDNLHDDDLDIYDEANNGVVFTHLSHKYLIERLVKSFQSNKRGIDNDDEDREKEENEEDLELHNETLEMKQEQHFTSANHQIPENNNVIKDRGKGAMVYNKSAKEKKSKQRLSLSPQINEEETLDSMIFEIFGGKISSKDARSSKICLSHSTEAEHETPLTRNHEKLSKLKRMPKKNGNLPKASTSAAYTSRNRGGIEIRGSIHSQAHMSHAQLHESKVDHTDFTTSEDNMEAFYDSLEAELYLSFLQNTTANNDSLKNSPSEKTQKTLGDLKDFVPNTVDYLLSSSSENEVTSGTKSVILQILSSIHQWSTGYKHASLKLSSATSDFVEVGNLEKELELNVKAFSEIEKLENGLGNRLSDLEEKKRELEEEINAVREKTTGLKFLRKLLIWEREMYENGKKLKAETMD